jgi:hemerythrin
MCIKEIRWRTVPHWETACHGHWAAVFARGSIMKFSSATWVARNVAGMMNQARCTISAQMERLSHAPDDQFSDGFTELIACLESNLLDEEAVMEALSYPALRSHREQHARALSALHHTQPQVEGGNIALGREALELLPQWLLMHRSTLDLALAAAARPSVRRARRHAATGFAAPAVERRTGGRYQGGQARV